MRSLGSGILRTLGRTAQKMIMIRDDVPEIRLSAIFNGSPVIKSLLIDPSSKLKDVQPYGFSSLCASI